MKNPPMSYSLKGSGVCERRERLGPEERQHNSVKEARRSHEGHELAPLTHHLRVGNQLSVMSVTLPALP